MTWRRLTTENFSIDSDCDSSMAHHGSVLGRLAPPGSFHWIFVGSVKKWISELTASAGTYLSSPLWNLTTSHAMPVFSALVE